MKHHQSFGLLLILAVLTERCAAEDDQDPQLVDDEDDCDCFLTNGSNPTYYSQHMFFDFRSLGDVADVPDVLKTAEAASEAPATSDYFSSDDWTSVWELQSWDNALGHGNKLSNDANILMANSPNNVYIEKNDDDDATSDTFMTMRTKRLPKFQTAAEFSSTSDYLFVSLRMLARTVGAPGAVTAMFTYRDAEELADVQEADIEMLTSGPRDKIQYTNQPSYSEDGDTYPDATKNASIPGDLRFTDWMVHRLDWTPDRCIWYVNGEETASIAFQTPRDASYVIFNVWSNGGSWSQEMDVYDEAYMQIQWIEMVYNSTDEGGSSKKRSPTDGRPLGKLRTRDDDDGEGSCSAVCSIDETDEAGAVMMLWNNASAQVRADGWTTLIWVGPWAYIFLVFYIL